MKKQQLRDQYRLLREALSPDEILRFSELAQDQILRSKLWPKSGRVGIYASVKSEVATHKLFQAALEQGLHVYFPRVEQGLVFYEVNGPESLQPGAWAIPEPSEGCHILEDDEMLDLLVVPGLVFNKKGFRIGYGRGFYDRVVGVIAKNAVGIGFDFQMFDEDWEHDTWDKILDAVFTDKRVIFTGGDQ